MFLLEGNLQILFTFSFCYCFFYALMQYIFMPTTLFHRSTGGSEKCRDGQAKGRKDEDSGLCKCFMKEAMHLLDLKDTQ